MNDLISKMGYASREEADEITRLARSKKWAEPMIRVESYDGRDVHRVQGSKAAAEVWEQFLTKNRKPPIQKFAAEKEPASILDPAAPKDLQDRFHRFRTLLDQKGVYAGTGHKRLAIPKNKLSEKDLGTLGFKPVVIAIPEAGQDRFQSFRHPSNNYHLHSHGDRWTMHEDRHPAATMLMKSQGVGKAIAQGIPHVVTEGLPGLGNYLMGQIRGRKSTADIVKSQVPGEVEAEMNALPDSGSYAKAAMLRRKLAELPPPGVPHVASRLKKRQRGWHFEKDPGFHDVKGKFDEAARKNTEIKVAAIAEALRTYGIDPKIAGEITDAPDPIKALTQVLKTKDFGFGGVKNRGRNFGEFASWSSPAGLASGDAASRLSGAGGYSPGTNMSYGGV
jgi:hypothetical protein